MNVRGLIGRRCLVNINIINDITAVDDVWTGVDVNIDLGWQWNQFCWGYWKWMKELTANWPLYWDHLIVQYQWQYWSDQYHYQITMHLDMQILDFYSSYINQFINCRVFMNRNVATSSFSQPDLLSSTVKTWEYDGGSGNPSSSWFE